VRYLVTGGAGFIGANLARRLVADGHEVRVLDNMSRGRADRLGGAACETVVPGDIRDAAAVAGAMAGCDSVIHMASVQGTARFYDDPRAVLDTAVRGTLNVLDACEKAGVRELLLVSSSEAYQSPPVIPAPETVPLSVPDPLNPRFSYGGGKIAAELMAIAWARAGILDRLIVVRPHNCYGIHGGYEHVIPQLATRMARLAAEHDGDGPIPFPIQGSGDETRAFCHVSDCVDAFALLLEKADPLGIYHVGNPEEVTIKYLVQLIGKHYNKDVEILPGALPEGSPSRRCPDISKMRALGYEPRIPLAQGLGPVLDWYREHPA
jgi:nucleoside-diphosphate-sugar epimerase